jgi:DNA primase
MSKYSRETVQNVVACNDIVDIVGSAVELKPAGSGRLKGLCPFHHEKTPSFTVNRARQAYHCFGCGKGGNVLSFLIENDGLSFMEALRKLADRAGITLPALTERESTQDGLRTQVLECCKFAGVHYRRVLTETPQGAPGRDYLKTRDLREETVHRFDLGYAVESWNDLLDAAKKQGFSAQTLEASGLFKRGDQGRTYDFFRNRVMFPIRDVSGNIVAFGGRDLGDSPAKYINSPETAAYKKSSVLYGLYDAREAMKQKQQALLVEGYFDLLRCFDAGIENVVASCGTALTQEQARLIRRYVPEVVVVYDGDAAGVKAALKGTALLLSAGLRVKALALPGGQDPDDFVRAEGGSALLALVEQAPDFLAFYVAMSQARLESIEGRTEVAQEIFGLLRMLDDELRVGGYLKEAAKLLGVHEWDFRREYQKHASKGTQRALTAATMEPAPPQAQPLSRDDCDFVAVLLENEALRRQAESELDSLPLGTGPLVEVLERVFSSVTVGSFEEEFETEAARQLYTAAATHELEPRQDLAGLVQKRINRFKREAIITQQADTLAAIRDAQRRQDANLVVQLVAQKVNLDRELQRVGAA